MQIHRNRVFGGVMLMVKYQIGDKVVIKSAEVLEHYYDNRQYDIVWEMIGEADTEHTITEIYADTEDVYYNLSNSEWTWAEKVLKPADEKVSNLVKAPVDKKSSDLNQRDELRFASETALKFREMVDSLKEQDYTITVDADGTIELVGHSKRIAIKLG